MSNRIVLDRTKQMGSRISDVVNLLAAARKGLGELNLILGGQGYASDTGTTAGTLQGDTGISAADQTRLQNLVIQANNELNGAFTTAVGVGVAGGTRQLIDAISTGG